VIIDIDPCALAEDTTISVTKITPQDPNVDLMIGSTKGRGIAVAVYDLEPDGLVFDSNITVTVKADVTDLIEELQGRVLVFLWDEELHKFVQIGDENSCNVVEDPCEVYTVTCTVELAHFSTIAMIRQMMAFYVDAAAVGANDGSSWTDAYNYLQDALGDVNLAPGDEIRVAEGTYYPDANTSDPNSSGDRTATFKLINRVAIKGGYAGFGATDPDARDTAAYATILSGNINLPGDMNDNSYHVVTANGVNETAVLDGFTIEAGNANGVWASSQSFGGGMYIYQASPTVGYCTFSENSADYASGAMHNYYHSSPRISYCVFRQNSGTYSGAMQNRSYCEPTLTNCIFHGNTASDSGAISNHIDSSPRLVGCTFIGNSATGDGGAIRNTSNSNPVIINCSFSGN
jgi:predicted outer membrane repeat protein